MTPTPPASTEATDAIESPIPAHWPFARTTRSNIAFGVLAGLAWRIGMRPMWMRVIFLVGVVVSQSIVGIAAYFALAIVMPVVDPTHKGHGMKDKIRVPSWIFLTFFLITIGPLLFVIIATPYLTSRPSLGSGSLLIIGAFIMAVGAILLFGRQPKQPQLTEIDDDATLTTASYGAGTTQTQAVPTLYRSPANTAIRVSIAVALMTLSFAPTQNFIIYPLAIGLIIASAIAISTRTTRKVAIPLAMVVTLIAGLSASTGMQIDSVFAQLLGSQSNPRSPYYADRYFQYRYVGAVRTSDDQNGEPDLKFEPLRTAFVGGEVTVRVQAPEDNKVVFDGRMTAGEIIVRNVDSDGNVTSEVSAQSGFWIEKKQTYGAGPKELHVKVHGGVGRIVLEIDRSERHEPVCHPIYTQPEGSYYCE